MSKADGKAPRALCAKCDNRYITKRPRIINSCGVCFYHPDCFRGVSHCECGFPTSKIVELGVECVSCKRKTGSKVGMPLFCPLHEEEAMNQLYLYGRRGINLKDTARNGCTPISVFQGNGLLNPKLSGDNIRALALKFAKTATAQSTTRFCMDGDTLYTIPGRIFVEISKPVTSAPHNILSIATSLFGEENASQFVLAFKREFPQYTINSNGEIKSTTATFGIDSVVDDASLVAYLERNPKKAHAVAPLIAQYPGAAKMVCSLLDSDKAVLVQSTGLIYLGTSKPKISHFSSVWESE